MHNQTNQPLINPMEFVSEKPPFIPVDDWEPEEQDMIFQTAKDYIFVNISRFFGLENNRDFNSFIISSKYKRAYNNPDIREHCCKYMNYFEKYYDKEQELCAFYARTKFLIDCHPEYNQDAFFYDLVKYIAHGTISLKLGFMNESNYKLNLDYHYKKNPVLCYENVHGKVLMKISLIMCAMIPLLCHFMYKRDIRNSSTFLLSIYDKIISIGDVDIYSKLYETSTSNVSINAKRNQGIWNMQDIRGTNITLHSEECVQNILINIMPKYVYNQNPVLFNYRSIQRSTDFQIIDIAYECNFISLSSSRRDEDLNSEFDKFESFLTKEDESLYLQKVVSEKDAMSRIELTYGPFDPEEIKHYRYALSDGVKCPVNAFQQELIFNIFYKDFGDPQAINAINLDDYIKLIIAARKILLQNNLVMLPYIISSKVTRLSSRKSINRKELTRIEASPLYKLVVDKYKDESIIKKILSILGTILSSEFTLIDYGGQYDGKKINVIPELIGEEILMYVMLI